MNDEDNDYGEEYEIESTCPKEGEVRMEKVYTATSSYLRRWVFECGMWVEV